MQVAAYQLHLRIEALGSRSQVGVNAFRRYVSTLAHKRLLGVQICNLGDRISDGGVVDSSHAVGSRVTKDLAHSVQIRCIRGLGRQCSVLR